MPSLLLLVFVAELGVQIVNNFGDTINTVLWAIYSYLPTEFARKMGEQRKLQREYLRCRSDLHTTSSQDEFAKWAKLKRHHDKMLTELEAKKASIEGAKSSFDKKMKIVRWLGTRGLQQFLSFWFRKEALLWLPANWFPYYAEWIISWPSAPVGSISIVMWSWACAGFFTLAIDAIRTISGMATAPSTARPVPIPTTGEAGKEKKTS